MLKNMTKEPTHSRPPCVHIVSHGPYCLDGVAAAVAVARHRSGTTIVPHFSGNDRINEVLCSIGPEAAPPGSELWITDISWTKKETDEHLRSLAERGVKIYWFDHHRTALKRYAAGEVNVPFAGHVVSEALAASRLVYEYLQQQPPLSEQNQAPFAAFAPVIALADDNDRWIHALPGSRELALTIRAMGAEQDSLEGYHALLNIDAAVTYTPAMRAALEKATREIQASFALAEQSRVSLPVPGTPYTLVAALCEGHPSEIGDAWGKKATQTVFAFYDLKGEGISLRRSPDCTVDLSQLAHTLGGGGHPAAAGCRPTDLHRLFAQQIAQLLSGALRALVTSPHPQSE
jgi:oligoribonuclease NrnB/cAMP/cGMP phosphodiesterase (DHH superfamily)